MKPLEKLFMGTNMTWKRVILLSLICGIIPGLLMIPEFLSGTSFQQPGISFEFWIFTALLIILNCEKPMEAGLKTFVFFLISQPLIYLVQVPVSFLGWGLFSYYPRWGIITLLTLPGGMLAWYVKKGNWLSVLLLTAANLILCVELPVFVRDMLNSFPCYLLTVVFIVLELIVFILLLFKDRGKRFAAFGLILVMLVFGSWYAWRNTFRNSGYFETELEGNGPFQVVSEIPDAEIKTGGNYLSVTVDYYCEFPIDLIDADGNALTVYFSYNEDGATWETESNE